MKWIGAGLGILLAACVHVPHKPQIAASAEQVSLPALIERSLITNAPEQFFVYVPSRRTAYHLEQNQSINQVAVNTRQYMELMWNETQLYDIHTHPRVTAATEDLELAVKRTIAQTLNHNWFNDEEFRRFTPSPTDIAGLVRATERYSTRKEYNREQGTIRFFIATEDNNLYLTEYALKKEGNLHQVVEEYTRLLEAYQATGNRDFREFQQIVNTQSAFLHLHTQAITDRDSTSASLRTKYQKQ